MSTDTRERMVETAAALIARRGVEANSIGDILAASGAPRGSLYHHFPGGKGELVLEATRLAVGRITAAIEQVMAESRDPIAGVRGYLTAAGEELRDSDWTIGCPVAPVVLDDPEAGTPLADLCRDTFASWEQIFATHLEAAGLESVRAASLATVIVAAGEGALLMARTRRSLAPLDAVAEELAQLLGSALA